LFTLTFGVSSAKRIASRPAAGGGGAADRLWNAGHRRSAAALGDAGDAARGTARRGSEGRESER